MPAIRSWTHLLVAALLPGLALASQACEPQQCGEAPAYGACPIATSGAADLVLGLAPTNLYFFNAAQHPVALNYVGRDGSESWAGLLGPGARREVATLSGEVWRARAIRPGHPADQQLLVEHHAGVVKIADCDCPNPEFVDVRDRPPHLPCRRATRLHSRRVAPFCFYLTPPSLSAAQR